MKEFEITLKVRVEARSLAVAKTHANNIVDDLKECGEEYVDHPINGVRWNRISPVDEAETASAHACTGRAGDGI